METNIINKSLHIALMLCCGVWLSCTNGNLTGQTVKEDRNLPSFTAVKLSMAAKVYLSQGNPQSVRIEADKGVLEFIETEVKENTLVIRNKEGHWRNMEDVKIYITVPEISHIGLSGSGDIISQTAIRSGDMGINVSGSGNVKISMLEASSIGVTVTGSGSVMLAGNNDQARLEATITGSGNLKAEDLNVADGNINVTGSGSARVSVLKTLETNITGSGNVQYKGNPTVNAHSTGSGRTQSL